MANMKLNLKISGLVLLMAVLIVSWANARISDKDISSQSSTAVIDFRTYIDANKILMFVTNKGSFAFDNSGTLGKSDGLYFPYSGLHDIATGRNTLTALFAGSIWIGAEVAAKYDPGARAAVGDTLVTSGQHSTDWSPGPLDSGGDPPADATTNPVYRVYKLYRDSLENNPNQDYVDWPVDQGAPVDDQGAPAMIGDQMLWSVYNDMDRNAHWNQQGTTVEGGLGIEVQQTVWAVEGSGGDTLLIPNTIPVTQVGETRLSVVVEVVDSDALTGHDYRVVTDSNEVLGPMWHLIDVTTGEIKLIAQTIFGGASPVVDGFIVVITDPTSGFTEFAMVANGTGPLNPPAAGALNFDGFPTPNNENPGDGSDKQPGQWAIHTADNGGSCDGGTRGSYDAFLSRTTRDGGNLDAIDIHDYEMRFTGSNANPGVNGSYAIEVFNDENVFWVPFELWDIGIETPNDASDDVRLTPWIIDDGDDDTYNLESWGCRNGSTFGGGGEHSGSGRDNDPFTDWVYWYRPADTSPGEAGYLADEAAMRTIPHTYQYDGEEVIARTVLISWNGDTSLAGDFVQDLPDVGTVFRILTGKDAPIDTFTFTATAPEVVTADNDGVSIYLSFKLYNKGPYDLDNTFVSIWSDPDLGDASDDLVGCDSLTDVHYCYNEGTDSNYGNRPPAVGFRLLSGPLVPSPGETAQFEGNPVPDHKNLGMTSFCKYINGTDPRSYIESWNYMRGLKKDGTPYMYNGNNVAYMHSGDPVTRVGDRDFNSSDRRMMANSGPFTFNQGDSQFVMVKLAVGQGTDAISSITRLREILNAPYDFPTAIDDEPRTALPGQYTLAQNYPNPFNPTTTIEYNLPRRSHVNIEIFNLLGQRVRTLVDRDESAGAYSVIWNGKDAGGNSVATGIYLYRMRAGDHVATRKMMLLK